MAARKSSAERFWARVDRRGPDECWPWTGCRNKQGYGVCAFARGKKSSGSHRAAWILTYGPIEGRLFVCHRCDNPPCCNLAHLFLGTQAENMADASAKGRLLTGDKSGPRRFREKFQGENGSNHKLTEADVRTIRQMAKDGVATRDIALRFSIVRTYVRAIVLRYTWKHLSD